MNGRRILYAITIAVPSLYGCGSSSPKNAANPDASGTGGSDEGGGGNSNGGSSASDGGRNGGNGGSSGGSGAGNSGSGGRTAGDGGRPNQVEPEPSPGDCGLDAPAFCETFEEEFPGGRAGPLDERIWGFARHSTSIMLPLIRRVASSSQPGFANTPTLCGSEFDGILPPDDVRICEGLDGAGMISNQMSELLSDGGGFALNSIMLRQPFDFTDREGTIVFDMDAKRNVGFDGHGWWTEIWISADPAPMPYHGAPTIASFPRRAVGFQLAPVANECFQAGGNNIGRVIIGENYELIRDAPLGGECIKTEDTVLNRFKIVISKDRAEFYVSDSDKPGQTRFVTAAEDLDLPFTYGYIHIQHAQYNAPKGADASQSQTYRWDNIGFDGPAYPPLRAYDVPDGDEVIMDQGEVFGRALGYILGKVGFSEPQKVRVRVQGVDLSDARRATFNFNINSSGGRQMLYRFNENEWHTFTVSTQFDDTIQLRSFSVEIPLEDLVPGENVIDLEMKDNALGTEAVSNMDISIEL